MKSILPFNKLVFLSSLLIAGCAAYYSILGIAMLFSGSKIAAMIMATSLEIGKLVSTSYLFKYWVKTKAYLKIYLTLSVLVLMFITSLGIFGYLTSSYQKSSLDNKFSGEKIVLLEQKKGYLTNSIVTANKKIESLDEHRVLQEKRLNDMLTNSAILRNPIQFQDIQTQSAELIKSTENSIREEVDKIKKHSSELDSLNQSISDIKLESLGKSDIITFKFVADEFKLPMDTVVKWFIVLIITVFDPLAICLLLAYNTTEESITETVVSEIKSEVEEKNLTDPKTSNIVETKQRRHDFLLNLFRK